MGNWEYYDDNICRSDSIVATFTNDKGIRVFDVYEGRSSFIAEPQVEYIHNVFVDYADAKETKEEKEKCTSSLEVLSIRLRKACEIIESNYNKQIDKMKGLFM